MTFLDAWVIGCVCFAVVVIAICLWVSAVRIVPSVVSPPPAIGDHGRTPEGSSK